MKTVWSVSKEIMATPVKVLVVSITDGKILLPGYAGTRDLGATRHGMGTSYFLSYKDAREYCVSRAFNRLKNVRTQLEFADSAYATMVGLPQERD